MIHVHAVVERNTNNAMVNNHPMRREMMSQHTLRRSPMMSVIICFIMTMSAQMYAQVTIVEEPEITNLMEQYRRHNIKEKVVRGWRIQILTTNDRMEMEQGISKFRTLYPDIPYKWEHNPPYYQVRFGAYELREDLEPMLLQLKRDFPSALPVQAEMEKKELVIIPR